MSLLDGTEQHARRGRSRGTVSAGAEGPRFPSSRFPLRPLGPAPALLWSVAPHLMPPTPAGFGTWVVWGEGPPGADTAGSHSQDRHCGGLGPGPGQWTPEKPSLGRVALWPWLSQGSKAWRRPRGTPDSTCEAQRPDQPLGTSGWPRRSARPPARSPRSLALCHRPLCWGSSA